MFSLPRVCLLTASVVVFQFSRNALRFWRDIQAEIDHARSGLPR